MGESIFEKNTGRTLTKVNERGIFNRDVIKYIAMLTMLLNHIANIFLEPGTILCTVFLNLGYFTAPVMCYFLVEGYHYTHSKKKYAKRLAVFAVLSEIPYCLAFSQVYNGEKIISFCGFNMIFTLLLCFGMLYVNDHVKSHLSRGFLEIVLFCLSAFSDWAFLAPMLTLLFMWSRGDQKKTRNAFIIGAAVFAVLNFQFEGNLLCDAAWALFSAVGILLAGIAVVYLYNGKRMASGKTFSKWFFYIFYPAHLLILGMIRIL